MGKISKKDTSCSGEYYIYDGHFGKFKCGERAKGLHLNRVIRDVMRECGYPCVHCFETDCFKSCGPNSVITTLQAQIDQLRAEIAELKAAG